MQSVFAPAPRPLLHRAVLACALLLGATGSAPPALAQRGGRSTQATQGLLAADTSIGLRLKTVPSRNGDTVVVEKIRPDPRTARIDFKSSEVLTHVRGELVTSPDQAAQLIEDWAARPDGPLAMFFHQGKSRRSVLIFPGGADDHRQAAVTDRRAAAARAAPPAAAATPVPTRAGTRDRRARATHAPGAGVHEEIADPWTVPGLVSRSAEGSGINVLRRVFIDPATGAVAFVGHYDPAFATGPVDYSTLLRDVLRSPAPSFSLEPTEATKSALAGFVRQFDQQMAANLSDTAAGKAWLTSLFNQLLTNPALETDRRRFVARGAALLGVPAEEIPASVRGMLNQAPPGSPEWIGFWSRCYEVVGAPAAAAYIRAAANKDNDPAAFSASLASLGLQPVIDDLRARLQSGSLTEAQAGVRLQVELLGAILRHCGVPTPRWRSAADRAIQTGDFESFSAVVDDLNANLVRERVIGPWLHGLVFTEQFLRQLHAMPALESQPVCRDGLAPDSELARTFLAADWTLKNLTVTPELSERVPGHLTPAQFIFREETARGSFDTGNVMARFWLTPDTLSLLHDDAGSVVDFDGAYPGIRAEQLAAFAGSGDANHLTRDLLPAYAEEVSGRYDEYARALPDLHRLREATKLIALVRWAQDRRLRLFPPEPPAPPRPLPASFNRGFWSAFFLIPQSGNSFFLGLSASGGVDFSAADDDDWVRSVVFPAAKENALGQLLGSAALGRAAVDAAAKGDLEAARALADQSARAMTGDFDFTGHPALPQIPEASPPSPVDTALLQTEVLTQTRQNLDAMDRARKILRQASVGDVPRAEAQAQWSRAESNLVQLRTLLSSDTPKPPARQIVQLLRNGEWDKLPKPKPAVAAAPAPAPAPKPARIVDPEERARVRGEITQMRTELCRIRTQLRRFNASVQSDLDQRAEWEKVTNDAYESALQRAQEKFEEFSVDFPGDILKEKLAAVTDPAERARIERALRLVDRFKDAYTTRDFADWAAKEELTREEVIEGVKLIAEICEVEDRIKDYLGRKWGLKRVIAFYDAADDLLASAYDVTAEVVAWRRLRQLDRNSDAFLQATEASGRRLRELIAAIHQREVRLGLDPGSSKEPCAAP